MLKLTYHPQETPHEDIELRLGGFQQRCDSYYLQLDKNVDPGDESQAKVRKVLVALLESWRERLADWSLTNPFYLPFGFWDQSSGWLRCSPNGKQLTIDAGESKVEGWSFMPSDGGREMYSLPDFDPYEECHSVTATRGVWLRAIQASLDELLHVRVPHPTFDPTPLFEHFRGSYGTELLTAAVAHFDLFSQLTHGPLTQEELADKLGLARRPVQVLTTALRAMDLLELDSRGRLRLSLLAEEHLIPGGAFDVGNYIGLAASSPGVLEMVERLKTNRPAGADDGGAAFIYREGKASAMEESELAKHFTLSLAGRAKNVAPYLADVVHLDGAEHLLDVAGGTGIYAIAFLHKNPRLKATVVDRPEVLRVAEECRRDYNLEERLTLSPGDMFETELPSADVVLLSNVLHDWDEPECRQLIDRCSAALPTGGRLIIHDVFLDDDLGGPLPIALYSAALFTLTEGRAYAAGEYIDWLSDAGFEVSSPLKTLIHCGALVATKGSTGS